MKPSVKLDKTPPYLFAELDKKMEAAKAKGIDIINLGIGDPDIPTLSHIVEAMHKAVDKPANHDYPPYQGTMGFKQAACSWMEKRFGVKLNPQTECITLIGSKEGIAHTILAYVDPEDYVLVPEPGYPVYSSFTLLSGATPYTVPLLEENGFLPDYSLIPEDIAKKAKILFLNYPNNPTGAVANLDFYKKTLAFAQKYDILVCNDMAYSEMCYDNYSAPSMLELEGSKDYIIEFYSLSKTYNMTGWRIGFAVGSQAAIKALGCIKNNADSGVFKAIQEAGIAALETPQSQINDLNNIYQQRRDIIINGLAKLGWKYKNVQATFYMWLPTPEGMFSTDFAALLLEKTGIVVAPGIGYGKYGEGYFRIALTRDQNRLQEAISRMEKNGITFDMAKNKV